MTTPDRQLAPTQQAGSGFIMRGLGGEVVILNVLRLPLSELPLEGVA